MKTLHLLIIATLSVILVIGTNAAFATTTNGTYSIIFGNATNLSSDGKSDMPQVDAYGNNVYAVWANFANGNAQIFFKKSLDGGATFGSSINLSNTGGNAHDPLLLVSGNNVYVVWLEDRPSNTYQIARENIFFARSADGGATFDVPINISKKNFYSDVTTNLVPEIAVSGNNVYVVWQSSNYNWRHVFLSKSTNNGADFDSGIDISNNDNFNTPQSEQIAAYGDNVYVIWDDYFNNSIDPPYNSIFFTKSIDDGTTFGSVIKISKTESAFDPQISVSGNNVYAIWDNGLSNNIYFTKSVDGGTTFANRTNIGNGQYPKLTANNDNVYAIWFNPNDVFFTKSVDGGTTFGNTIKLSNNTWGLSPYENNNPPKKMVVLGDNIYVSWRYPVNPNGNHAPFFVISNNGGNTFSNPINLSKDNRDSQDLQLAASSNNAYAIWSSIQNPNSMDVLFIAGSSWQSSANQNIQSSNLTIPEYPFAMPILVIGIASLVVFYKIKFRIN